MWLALEKGRFFSLARRERKICGDGLSILGHC